MERIYIFLLLLVYPSIVFCQQPEKEVIAIYPFSSYHHDYYSNATLIGDAVETGFVKSGRFRVVERSKFNQLKQEDKFKEANTSEVVKIASRFGAKTVVLGHVASVSSNSERKKSMFSNDYFTSYECHMTFKVKLVDVETGEIRIAESLTLKGSSNDSHGAALGEAYSVIDDEVKQFIGAYFPQRFLFMEVTDLDSKKNAVKEFKIWAGSDQGIDEKHVVEVYEISHVKHPVTGQVLENKELIGQAQIIAINGASISTCKMMGFAKDGSKMQAVLSSKPESIVIEYVGGTKSMFGTDVFKK